MSSDAGQGGTAGSGPGPGLRELVDHAVSGDRSAAEALINLFRPLVWGVVRSNGVYGADAEDVVQETWLRMLTGLPRLRDPEALPGWLATTARRSCFSVFRVRERVSPRAVLPDGELLSGDPCEAALRAESSSHLAAALSALSPRERKLVRLLGEGRAYKEISTLLAMPVGSIGPTRERLLAKLVRHQALRSYELERAA